MERSESFQLKYKLNFDHLIDLRASYLDASDHYYHKEENKVFSYCFADNKWYIPDLKFGTMIYRNYKNNNREQEIMNIVRKARVRDRKIELELK